MTAARVSRRAGVPAAALAAGLAADAARRAARAERAHPPVGEFVRAEGVRLHWTSRGSGRPVVLLHGNPGFVQDYTLTVMDALAADVHAIAFDRPGHGYSDRPPGEAPAERQAALLRAALARLGVRRAVLVGHSWGGALVLAYALAHPDEVAGVVLLAAGTHPGPPAAPVRDRLLSAPLLGAAARWTIWPLVARDRVRANLETAYAPDPVRRDHGQVAEALWSRPGQVGATARDNLTLGGTLGRLAPRYGDLGMPVAVVVGVHDPFVVAAQHSRPFAAQVPEAEVVTLDTGHEVAHTRPGDVTATIKRVACA